MSSLSEINLNLLVALGALIDECSVSRAAERLGVTQSAMSHSLRQLRELLGDRLLVRGPRGMLLTPRAEALRAPLRRGLGELERVVAGEVVWSPASEARVWRATCSGKPRGLRMMSTGVPSSVCGVRSPQ